MSDSLTPSLPAYSEGIRRRLLKGIGANALGQVINLGSRIIFMPMFLRAWGVDIYGEWLVLSSFVAYLSLTDMGGQLYIVNRLTQAYAQKNNFLFRRVLHTGLALFLILPTIVFLVFIASISAIPLETILQIKRTGHKTIVLVSILLASQLVFSLPQGILLGVYRAVGLLARGMMLANLLQILQLILIAGILWKGGGMLLVAGTQIIPTFLITGIALIELNKRFPQFSLFSLKEAQVSLGQSFIKPSLHFLSIQLSYSITIQGTLLIVSALLGSAQVVLFSTLRTMVNVMRQLLGLLAHTSWPEMTRLDAERDKNKLLILFRAILRSTLVMGAVFTVFLHYWGRDLYHLWLGPTIIYRQNIMDLFLGYLLQLIFWTACSHLLMATNQHHTLSKILLISSLITIVFAFICGYYFGLEGVVSGILVSDLVLPFWYVPFLLMRYEPRISFIFYLRELAPIVVALISCLFMPWVIPVIFVLLFVWWKKCLLEQGFLLKR